MMETLVSGLKEDFCREFVGAEFWAKHELRWCPPAVITEQAPGRQMIWLYRAPWAIDGHDGADTRTGLRRWLHENRAILNLRRQLGSNLILVNADRISPFDLRARLGMAQPDSHRTATVGIGNTNPHNDLLARLFDWVAPEYWEVLEALEAVSWLPSGTPIFRGDDEPDQKQLFSLLDTLADSSRYGAEIIQLTSLAEDGATANKKLQQDNQELKQEYELLLVQLHQVQEELEQYYLKNIELDKKNIGLGKILANEKKALAAAQHGNKALKVQVRKMQEELKRQLLAASMSAAQSAQPGSRRNPLRLLLPGTARRVLGRSKLKRAQQAQLTAIRNSEWFDRQWYLDTYPDIRASSVDPAEHYLTTGWKESRNPSAKFNTAYYLRSNPDIAHSGLNPLWHFIQYGHKEGRRPAKS